MVKADVDHRFDSKEDLDLLLQTWWKDETIKSFHKLRGGYSGTNYYILTNSSKEAVMKICHGYTLPEVESQFKISFYLFDNGYDFCCHPFKLPNANPESYFTTLTKDEQPVVLMNFLPGKAGDVVIDSAVVEKSKALKEIGYFLGMMHNTPLKETQKVRNFVDEGICLLGKHIRGEFANLFKNHSEEYITNHPYVKFYFDHYDLFLSTIAKCQSFRQSVIHGDAFLDNIILDSVDGHLLGFVDFEDACFGPCILDLACCIVGNVFNEGEDPRLDIDSLKALISGYIRSYPNDNKEKLQEEITILPTLLICALIVNSGWRFQNFNIVYPEMRSTHGQAYYELQKRIEVLESREIKEQVDQLIQELLVINI